MKLSNVHHWVVILWAEWYQPGEEWLFSRHQTLEAAVSSARHHVHTGWEATICEVDPTG